MVTAILHQLFRPYSSSLLNKFDGYILQCLALVSATPLAKFYDNFDSCLVVGMTFVLVILPSLVFIVMSLLINKEEFKKVLRCCYNKCLQLRQHNKIPQSEIPLIINEGSTEFYNIIHHSKRKMLQYVTCKYNINTALGLSLMCTQNFYNYRLLFLQA